MSDLDDKNTQEEKPRVGLPKISLGNAPKPPDVTKAKTQEEIADTDEQPDLEKYSFFSWNSNTKESDKGWYDKKEEE